MAIPKGEIYILRDVPLTVTYEHTIDFKDRTEQFNYFRGFIAHTLENYTYIRRDREYVVVELPLLSLENVNYMLFRSEEGSRLYYAFITDIVYVNDVTTQIFYTVDVMQTYQFEFTWKPSYIKQGHVDRWDANHKPIYSRTDEGLDYGTEYAVESAFRIQQSDAIKWALVSCVQFSELVESGYSDDGGTLSPTPPPFVTFVLPMVFKRNGFESPIVNIGGFGFSTYDEFVNYMQAVSIGNYVKSITILPYAPFVEREHYTNGQYYIDLSSAFEYEISTLKAKPGAIAGLKLLVIKKAYADTLIGGKDLATAEWNIGIEESLPTSAEWDEVKKNPYTTKRDKRFESKLLCAPYRYNLLTDWRNNPVVFKNEYMTTDQITVRYSFAFSHNAPFRFWIKDYKRDPEGRYTCLSQLMALEMPIVSDAYYTYLLENKNTIQANVTNSIINASAGVISGAVNGASMGVKGAIAGAVGGAVSGALNVSAMLRSENAKQADIRAKPDTVLNTNDSTFNVNDRNADITFYRMAICCENEEILAEIFNMTGYRVNRVDVPNTRSRARFNYLQTAGANIVGSFNQTDLARIKAIFDNGITIWHYHEKEFHPLDYSYENIEVNLI